MRLNFKVASMSHDSHTQQLATMPIKQLFMRMAIPLILGLLVSGPDPIYTPHNNETFIKEGVDAVNRAIDKVKDELKSTSTFNEISIFIYEFYKDLK